MLSAHPTDRSRRLFWWGWALPAMLTVLVVYAITGGCASNPVSIAQTPLQKAYAVYGEFVIFEEQAAALKQNGTLTGMALLKVQQADNEAKPVADALLKAIRDTENAGTTTSDALTLSLTLTTSAVNNFVAQIKTVHAPP